MIDVKAQIEQLGKRRVERRKLMQAATAGTAAMAAGGVGLGSGAARAQAAVPYTATDAAVIQFALNLEYLEAEYYLRGVTGVGLTSAQTGGGPTAAGTVNAPSTTVVPFTSSSLAYYFIGIASDENAHVNVLRGALTDISTALNGGATNYLISEPNIDLEYSFQILGGLVGIPNFNPFADEVSFLLGSYIFEDVGVTAYAGAASLLTPGPNGYLPTATQILAVEGYHAGAVRGVLADIGAGAATNAISNLRSTISVGPNGFPDDYGTNSQGNPYNFASVDPYGTAFTRTTSQVLNIVYGNATGASVDAGLFFPQGVNGQITAS